LAVVLACLLVAQALLETFAVGVIPLFVAVLQAPELVLGNRYAGPVLSWLGASTPNQLVVVAGLAVLIATFSKTAVGIGANRLQTNFLVEAHTDVVIRLTRAYLHAPYRMHLARNSSEMVRNVLGETGIVFSSIVTPLLTIATEGLVAILVASLIVYAQPLVAGGAFVFFGLAAIIFYRLIRRELSELGLRNQMHGRAALQWLTQALVGVKEAQLYGKEDFFTAAVERHFRANVRASNELTFTTQLPRYFNELVAVLGMLVVTFALLAADVAAIVPTLVLFAVAAMRIIPSLSRILTSAGLLRYGLPALRVVYGDLQAVPAPPAAALLPDPAAAPERFESLVVEELTHRYGEASRFQIVVPNLRIARGESVAFVGPSGSGKTTLIDLLVGLLEPDSGRILINGRDLRTQARAWRQRIGYIPQAIYLLDDTIRRNVAFGEEDARIDVARVDNALRVAQLEEFVDSLPDGPETMIGDRGVRLSGGQRQRIGIARALYRDPELLILDEGTSALDGTTEAQLVEAIGRLGLDKTKIVIAHRLSTVATCDRILFMQDGRILVAGTFDELRRTLPEFQAMLNAGQAQGVHEQAS
jgi:ATP-binding cassette subfamily C protein